MSVTTFDFPVLPPSDVVHFFKISFPHLGMNENDIVHPQAERWQTFYLAMLESCTGCTQDQLFQAPFNATQTCFEHPELHEQSVPLITFSLAMNRLLATCGVKNFTMMDLVEPKKKKTTNIVSAIINFIRFKEERMIVYEQIKTSLVAVQDRRDHLLKINHEISNRIDTINDKKAKQEPEINRLQSEFEKFKTKLNEEHKPQVALQKIISDMKASISEVTTKIDNIKVSMLSAKEDGETISKKIVQSPERMKSEQESMKSQLEHLKQQKAELLEKLATLENRVLLKGQMGANCDQGLQLILAIDAEINKEREVLAEISTLKDKTLSQKDELRDLLAKEQQLERLLTIRQEKIQKMKLQHQHKMLAVKENIQQAKEKKSHFEDMKAEVNTKSKDIMYKRNVVLENIEAQEKEHASKMTQLQNAYEKLLAELKGYHVQIEEASLSLINELPTCTNQASMLDEYT